MVQRVTGPWNAAARRLWLGLCRKASSMCQRSSTKAEQQASNRAAPPEHAEEERQKPKRGLTLRLTGVPKARPS